MTLFAVDIQKKQGNEYWTNRYILNDASLGSASVSMLQIAQCEVQIHTTNVVIDRGRVRPLAPGGDSFIIVPYGYNGGYEGGSLASQLPLFDVVRVDLEVSEGRPSRKYYRTGLTDSMVSGSQIAETYAAFVDTQVTEMITDLAGKFVDVDGQGINSATVFRTVAMRQLRRGSRRRLQPII